MNEIISQKSGIYKIENKITGDLYIGQTYCFAKRERRHFRTLKIHTHFNRYLQRAWNKYGEENFEFVPILICSKENLVYYEQKCVDLFNPKYNICKECVNSTLGTKMPPESVIRRAVAISGKNHPNYGKHLSEETRKKLSVANTGHHPTPETLEKLRNATLNFSEDTKEKIRKSLTGKKHSEETKRKISERNKGIKRSDEQKRQMSLVRIGKPLGHHSKETKRKIGDGNRGKHRTEEMRKIMSESMKLVWTRKKYTQKGIIE